MRSTNPGKLSSSQDFSIGRSISLTRSSNVRALLLSTVLARLLKADSTADTVERDKICRGGAAADGGSNAAAYPAMGVQMSHSASGLLTCAYWIGFPWRANPAQMSWADPSKHNSTRRG